MTRLLFAIVLATAFVGAPRAQQKPNPQYSDEQLQKLRTLVARTRTEANRLEGELAERQRELAQVFDRFELDAERAKQLQADIVDLQRQLLANHLRMQAELRKIVDKEQFEVLKKRLKGVFPPGGAKERPKSK